jgi:hypothetical protein
MTEVIDHAPDIVDWQYRPLTMAEYTVIQDRLHNKGFKVREVCKCHVHCSGCGNEGSVVDIYWNDIHERIFAVCLNCWCIREATPIFESMLAVTE